MNLAKTGLLAAVASLASIGTASADVEQREHRTQPAPAPSPGPEAREHRTQPSGGSTTVVYRRRPGPRWMVPLKIDIGATTANTDAGFLGGVEIRAGIHWASLSPTPTNIDIGLGVFGAALPGPKNMTTTTDDDSVVYGGVYLEGGKTLSHGRFWRTWGTGRAEYLASDAFGVEDTGFGLAGRLSAELYASGVGIEPRGVFLGTYAVGVYVEAAARDVGVDNVSVLQISAGLTFRTPLVLQP